MDIEPGPLGIQDGPAPVIQAGDDGGDEGTPAPQVSPGPPSLSPPPERRAPRHVPRRQCGVLWTGPLGLTTAETIKSLKTLVRHNQVNSSMILLATRGGECRRLVGVIKAANATADAHIRRHQEPYTPGFSGEDN